MTRDKKQYPKCFGRLETVFPLKEDGLRHTPESCMVCEYKTQCLKTAMNKKEGLNVKEELVDRSYRAGTIGFLARWSRKKDIARKKKKDSHENDPQ
ncbi:MAG: hypothetical protein R6U50_12385 [Desulfobacterales bacterium]